jgi:hypothetical protein
MVIRIPAFAFHPEVTHFASRSHVEDMGDRAIRGTLSEIVMTLGGEPHSALLI